jgi:hypothetical protein
LEKPAQQKYTASARAEADNGAVRSPTISRIFSLLFATGLGLSVPIAKAQESVRLIEIHSGWGGLGTSQNADVLIRSRGGAFFRDGKRVDAAQVQALVAALEAPRITKPDTENLGVTSAWLKEHVTSQHPRARTQALQTTANQQELFTTSFTNPDLIAKVLPELFEFSRTDDYPFSEVEVTFENGSKIRASSHSYYVYMLPWTFDGKDDESYNADISRTVSALLPPKTVNKSRLEGDDFLKELVDAVMSSIETEWNLLGSEDRAGDALRALRSAYVVERSDINPYHNVDYGIPWSTKGPYETNLHVTLRKASFPPNVSEELILLYDHDKVQGVEEFLKTGLKYEDLVLSVPWLNDYIHEHPRENIFLMHVHDTSFGDQAMRTFTLDMKARGREDLIPTVRAQQARVALLKIGYVYWLVFPDKHMMLWRYEGPSGFLKWKQSDFPAGLCGAYPVNNGGCSGREVAADGTLMAEGVPRDRACMATNQAASNVDARPVAELFPVMDHDRAGFIDHTGKKIIPLCFDKVGAFSEGLARFERDGNWGYIDASGSVVIEPRFPWAEEFSEGLARVQISGLPLGYNGQWGFIDKSGKVVIPPDYKSTFGGKNNIGGDDQEDAFHDGLAKIEVDHKTGFIDKTGKVVIPAEFTYAYPFSEGLAAVTKSPTGDDGWGYIDPAGKWVIAPQFAWASSFQDHLAPVSSGHDCGYIDPTGAYVLKPPVSPGEKDCAEMWGHFSEGLSRWKFGKKYGYIDRSGKVVIKPKFDLTFHFSEGLAAVEVGGQWGYVDKVGKMVIAPKALAHVEDFHQGLAFVTTKDGRYGYIDKSGNYVWMPTLLYNN